MMRVIQKISHCANQDKFLSDTYALSVELRIALRLTEHARPICPEGAYHQTDCFAEATGILDDDSNGN